MASTCSSENQQKTFNSNASNEKIVSLIKRLEIDLNACDFKWTLFVAAANSYKYDSLIKPFPNAFVVDKILNINHLRKVIKSVPSFDRLLAILKNNVNHSKSNELNDITEECIDLLYWCLIRAKEPTLKSIHPSNVSKFQFQEEEKSKERLQQYMIN